MCSIMDVLQAFFLFINLFLEGAVGYGFTNSTLGCLIPSQSHFVFRIPYCTFTGTIWKEARSYLYG